MWRPPKKTSRVLFGRMSSTAPWIGAVGDQSGMNDVGDGICVVDVDVGTIGTGDL